ncbi:hypothetical protein FACS1894130_12020 [Spirochaetia bacterium]|nr:hypothetical protein FACS1894130_12020 [Spirochaetia bacterium]
MIIRNMEPKDLDKVLSMADSAFLMRNYISGQHQMILNGLIL